jgi:hypothetical protein
MDGTGNGVHHVKEHKPDSERRHVLFICGMKRKLK